MTDLQANTATLHATIDVARRVERAEIEFCALAGATSASIDVCDVAGGRALFSRAGSPLNKVLGLGLFGPVTDDDLHRIEKFYGTRGVPTQIELCPLAYGDLAARLCARGYVLEAFENELGMLLAGAPDAKPLTIEQMIGMMSQFGHPKIDRYLAWVDGEPAGGGAAWAHEGVVGIFGTATLPRFRRRGVQAAITLQAMEDARGRADLAIATTAPGSTSQRTFERLGYRVLYTRAVFLKS